MGVLSRRAPDRLRGPDWSLVTLLVALLPVLLLTVIVAVLLNDVFVALFSLDFGALRLPGSLSAPLSSLGVRGIGTAPGAHRPDALRLFAGRPQHLYRRPGGAAGGDRSGAGDGHERRADFAARRTAAGAAAHLRGRAGVYGPDHIGIATVAFLIGAGGLGTFIERGISQQVPDLILLGALPIIALALLADALLRAVGQLVTPRGIR